MSRERKPDFFALQQLQTLCSRISVFQQMPEHVAMEMCGRMTLQRVATGQVIFNEGDHSACMYLVLSGAFSLFAKEDGDEELDMGDPTIDTRLMNPHGTFLTNLQEGAAIGVWGLINQGKRSSTCICSQSGQLGVLTESNYLEVLCALAPNVMSASIPSTVSTAMNSSGELFLSEKAYTATGQRSAGTRSITVQVPIPGLSVFQGSSDHRATSKGARLLHALTSSPEDRSIGDARLIIKTIVRSCRRSSRFLPVPETAGNDMFVEKQAAARLLSLLTRAPFDLQRDFCDSLSLVSASAQDCLMVEGSSVSFSDCMYFVLTGSLSGHSVQGVTDAMANDAGQCYQLYFPGDIAGACQWQENSTTFRILPPLSTFLQETGRADLVRFAEADLLPYSRTRSATVLARADCQLIRIPYVSVGYLLQSIASLSVYTLLKLKDLSMPEEASTTSTSEVNADDDSDLSDDDSQLPMEVDDAGLWVFRALNELEFFRNQSEEVGRRICSRLTLVRYARHSKLPVDAGLSVLLDGRIQFRNASSIENLPFSSSVVLTTGQAFGHYLLYAPADVFQIVQKQHQMVLLLVTFSPY